MDWARASKRNTLRMRKGASAPFFCAVLLPALMDWKVKPWKDVSRDEWHAVVRLRVDVFVLEQDCPYSDLDGKDLRALHVWLEDHDVSKGHAVAAYARVLAPGVSYREPSIGRVVTRYDRRGEGLGRELMRQCIDACQREWPGRDVRISAQCYLEQFYLELGFATVGEPYLEDGIPHVEMVLSVVG